MKNGTEKLHKKHFLEHKFAGVMMEQLILPRRDFHCV